MNADSPATEATASQAKPSTRAARGTIPPALRLSEAIDLSRKINDSAAGSTNHDGFSQLSGNTKTSSTFLRKLSSLRQYGLIEDKDSIVVLTDIGGRVVTPRDENDDALAAKEALIRIELLSKLHDKLRGRLLPEDTFLRNILLQEFKLPRELASSWMEHFKDALNCARLIHVRPDGKLQVLESPSVHEITPAMPAPKATSESSIAVATARWETHDALPIVLGPTKLAFLRLPESWEPKKDLKRLLRMIQIALDEDAEAEEESKP